MKGLASRTCIVLIVLAALLTLPIAETASPAEAKRRPQTVTRTFRNATAIELSIAPTPPVSASLYPAPIPVRGLKGKIRDVNLHLNGLEHPYPDDVQVLLVGPRGQIAQVMGNVGGSTDVNDVTLRLDDEAAASLPNDTALSSGTFNPTAAPGSTDIFNPPAPLPRGNSALSVFRGSNPNGTWRLFVQDEDAASEPGSFAEGWALEITTKVKPRKRR